VNQTADYARVLAAKIGTGGALTSKDYEQLGALHSACVQLNQQLLNLSARYDAGEPVFGNGSVTLSATSVPEEQNEPAVDYPVLLYDGPFSDARDNPQIQLSGKTLSQDEAAKMLSNFVGSDRVKNVAYTGDSQIFSSCYEFIVTLKDDNTLTAGITKTGGHVVYMLPDQENSEVKLTEGDCIDQGLRFLSAHGYENMQVNYWRKLDGILTVNYASTQGGVLLYPDLVKLQISMKDGLVVGIEAVNYLTNHHTRVIPDPLITEEDAKSRINPSLTIERVRRCIIPLDEGEVQCWEVTASISNDERYLVYVDAMTGAEKTILRVMQDDEGFVTQ
jgi:germination protein YpeB